MKKKNKKSIETAVEIVNNLKSTEVILLERGQDLSTIKPLETSLRKIEKIKKEINALKDKLKNKKTKLNQEKELMWELVRTAKKTMQSKPEKQDQPEKTKKMEKKQKVKKSVD